MNLIADIGGTNARFALAGSSGPRSGTLRSYRNADFARFDDLLNRYMQDIAQTLFECMVIAVAGPVRGDVVHMTNLDWHISVTSLVKNFGIQDVRIINDLTALGYATRHLEPETLEVLVECSLDHKAMRQALVVGIGTGFNVSPVIYRDNRVICLSVEAGHVSLPTSVAREMDRRVPGLDEFYPTVEHCFSGRGLRDFLRRVTGEQNATVMQMIDSYRNETSAKVTDALDLYAVLLGQLLRELTLAYLPTGGIFLAGSVARSILSLQARSQCSQVLSRPSRFYSDRVPAWIVTEDSAALIGCAQIALAN